MRACSIARRRSTFAVVDSNSKREMIGGTALGFRRSSCSGSRSRFIFGVGLDLETESGLEGVVSGYSLYTSSRDLLASGTIKS